MDEQPTPKLLSVTSDELEQAVSHALRFDGRKHFKLAGEIMGKITAAHLVRCLTQGGFVGVEETAASRRPRIARTRRARAGSWMPPRRPTGGDGPGKV